MQNELNLPPQAESALNRLQDTVLSPMEEVLFQSWSKANKIEDPDNPKDVIDYRGIYKVSNGAVLPHGELKRISEITQNQHELEKALHQRMMERIQEAVDTEQDFEKQLHKEERQDITHKQKMEMEGLKLKRAPHDLKMKEHDVKGKEMDIHKQKIGLDAQQVGNEGKKIDLLSALLAPQRPTTGPNEPKGG